MKQVKKIPFRHFSYRKILLSLLAVFIIAFTAIIFSRDDSPQSPASLSPVSSSSQPTKEFSPPTDAEKKEADQRKETLISQPEASSDNTTKKKVTPIITYADSVGVNAFVPGVFEENGTCTATYLKDDNKITASSKGFQNSNYTSCAPIKLNGALSLKGEWNVSVKYNSNNAGGVSEAYSFEVQ